MAIRFEPVDGSHRETLASSVYSNFETFVRLVELSAEANTVLSHARLAAEAVCHAVLLSLRGEVARDANPRELVHEIRRLTKEFSLVDDKLVVLLDNVVGLGNLGSHFEPTRTLTRRDCESARSHVRELRDLFESRFPNPSRPPHRSAGPLSFDSIRLTPGCLWGPSHRDDKVHEPFDVGFHQLHSRHFAPLAIRTRARTLDPIFDVVVRNEGERPVTVDRVGLHPLRIWTDLKGLPAAQKLKTLGRYRIALEPMAEGEPQYSALPDPVEVAPGAAWRFELQLEGFRPALPGNELTAVIVLGGLRLNASSPVIYLGVY